VSRGRHRRIPAWSAGWLACAVLLAGAGAAVVATGGPGGPNDAVAQAAAAPEPVAEPVAAPVVVGEPGARAGAPSAPVAAAAAVRTVARADAAPLAPVARLVSHSLPDPVRVRVPRLGIDAALDPLHLGPARELVPPSYGRAGWYQRGPEPGELGRSVIAGHVDSRTGPDVFFSLRKIRVGDRIVVDLGDGTRVVFRVQEAASYPKSAFPTKRVYGGKRTTAQLRLITCSGAYDRDRGGYQENLVVFASRA
jgi:hypothetical protein